MPTDFIRTEYGPCSPSNYPRRAPRVPDWNAFYKNGLPEEVIVLEDSPDTPNSSLLLNTPATDIATSQPGPPTKKRRLYDHDSRHATVTPQNQCSAFPIDQTNNIDALSSRKRRRTRQEKQIDDDDGGGIRQDTKTKRLFEDYKPPRGLPTVVGTAAIRRVKSGDGSCEEPAADDADGHIILVPGQHITKQYRVEKLLGQGTFGKVVQAYDLMHNEHVALKVVRSNQKYRYAAYVEARVLQTLQNHDPGNKYGCIHSKDVFDYKGHICIAMDLLSLSVYDFLRRNQFAPFPNSHIQSIAHQLLTSVAYLHDLRLIHTDLKPENILLRDASYQSLPYSGKIPSTSSNTSRTGTQRRVLLNTEICVIDFGSSTFEAEYHSSVVSTRHYRAPEIILGIGWSYPCDIWSIACILVELFTGDLLFGTHDNREHLAMMEVVCGCKVDYSLIRQANGRSKTSNAGNASYFKRLRLNYPVDATTRSSKRGVKAMKKLSDVIPSTNDFLTGFLELLQKMLMFDPKKRITARQALRHPWFGEISHDDGTEAARLCAEYTSSGRKKRSL
ncbi:dual specificity protein kinase kns1, partial [Conoideocrella luteorostrata]